MELAATSALLWHVSAGEYYGHASLLSTNLVNALATPSPHVQSTATVAHIALNVSAIHSLLLPLLSSFDFCCSNFF